MKFIERNLNFIGILLLTLFVGAAAGLYWDVPGKIRRAVSAKEAASRYACPMHPQIVRDAPGKCPECGMRLVKILPTSSDQTLTSEKGGCCGDRPPAAPSADATCPHMAALTNASSCPAHSEP